jgi:hypothetical protein
VESPELKPQYQKKRKKKGMLAHVCNPSTQEAEEGGSQVWGQQRKTLVSKKKKKRKEKEAG